MKRVIQWFAGFSLYFGLGSFSIAQESLQSIELLTSPLPIFSVQQDDQRVSGYSVEYARDIFELAGYKSTVTAMPFAQLIHDMQKDTLVVATGVGRTPDREDEFFWIAPMTANVIGIFSIADKSVTTDSPNTASQNNIGFDGLEKLKSVAVLQGDYRANILRNHGVKNVVEFKSWEQAVNAVLNGSVSSVFFSELGISMTCELANLDCTSLAKTYTHNIQFSYMAMLKTDQNRKHAIKLANTAENFITTNAFSQLVAQWLPKLQKIEASVRVTEGVITFGDISNKQSAANKIWVLTHLEPPFSRYDERGKPSGYAVELVQGILTEAGLRQQILVAPWQRILVESEMKSDVLVFALARTHAREDNFHWISPITQNAYAVFARKPILQNSLVTSIEQLPPRSKIAVLADDFREKVILDAGHIAIVSPTWQIALQTFLDDEADFFFFSDGGLGVLCLAIEDTCSDIVRVFQYQLGTSYLAVSKHGTSPQLVEKLSSAAAKFKQTTQYKVMVKHWLSEFKQSNMPKIHEQDGILKLWEKD